MQDTGVQREIEVGADRRRIAIIDQPGAEPAIIWLGGFRSDMTGSKAEAIAAAGLARGLRVVRFDYSGHGRSGGRFEDGRIGRWLEEARAVIAASDAGRVVLVGSSMGGWLSLLVARDLALASGEGKAGPAVAGLVLIAPAPDFPSRLMEPAFTAAMRQELEATGVCHLPSAYGDPVPISAGFLSESHAHNLLDGPILPGAPVHILQGMADPDVPWQHAMAIAEQLPSTDMTLTFIKDGDHRLSRPADLELIVAAVERMAGRGN